MKNNYLTTINIDARTSSIRCTAMVGMDEKTIVHEVKSYPGLPFDESFYKTFKAVVAEFVKERPSESIGRISLILPDNAVALDVINVPTMRNSFATKKALNDALSEIYKNLDDLKVQSFVAAQNKQYTTFNVAAVQKKILTQIYSICSENRLFVDTTTYASSACVAASSSLVSKNKSASYLLLDIKRTYSRYVFVVNGRAVGFYYVPFGLDFLTRPQYVQEDMLFDHSMADLTVLNAKEKAKARKLSVLAEENITALAEAIGNDQNNAASEGETEAELTESELAEGGPSEGNGPAAEAAVASTAAAEEEADDEDIEDLSEPEAPEPFNVPTGTPVTETPKYMAKKTPRRIPKFMQRPIPETPEDIAKENFRVFVKWALTLIAENGKLTALSAPAFVLVNLPVNYSYVLDAANAEKEEQGIEFRRLGAENTNQNILANLEIYGGFFPKLIHPCNKF